MEIGKYLNNNTFQVKYVIKYADENSGQNIFNLLGKDGIGDMLEYFDNNNKNGNIYLVNYKPLQDIKIDLDYKIMRDEFENNEKIKKIFLNTNQHFIDINDLIKLLPQNLIQKYKEIKIKIQENIEPNMIAKNITQNEQIFIFDKFEILDKKLLRYFFPNFDNLDNIKAECSYAAGKLIINLPKYLNPNKFVTLIGSLDLDYKKFICSYILVYDSDISQNNHNNFILNNLDQYLDTIKGDNAQIVFEGKKNRNNK